MNIHESHEVIAGKVWLQLVEDEDGLGNEIWFVRVSDGTDHADADPCSDRFQAATELRETARGLGYTVPYVAPAFEEAPVAEDPEQTAGDVFWKWHEALSRHYANSEEAEKLKEAMRSDPEMIKFREEIHAMTPSKSGDWIFASIRVACKRIEARETIEAEKEAARMNESIPHYGAF